MMLRVVELFSGTASVGSVFKERGHVVITVDNNPEHNPDVVADVLSLDANTLISRLKGRPDVVWASPPCQSFSVAALSKNWCAPGQPKTERARHALDLVKHTLNLINDLSPTYWFVENPRAMLRTMPMMQSIPRRSISYCQYGDRRMKPTDLWGKFPPSMSWRICVSGAKCHEAAPRGARTGTQGLKNAKERGRLPRGFCVELVDACEQGLGVVNHESKGLLKWSRKQGL